MQELLCAFTGAEMLRGEGCRWQRAKLSSSGSLWLHGREVFEGMKVSSFAIPEILSASNLARVGSTSTLHKVVLCGPVVKNSRSASSCFWYIRSCRESQINSKQLFSCLLLTWCSKLSRCPSNNNSVMFFLVSKSFMLHSCYPTAIWIVPIGTAENCSTVKYANVVSLSVICIFHGKFGI